MILKKNLNLLKIYKNKKSYMINWINGNTDRYKTLG
jgi:hypothetical protein